MPGLCFCCDSSCVFREGWGDVKVKLPEPCPLVLLLIEWCFWCFRVNKFWIFCMWLTVPSLLHACIWHDCAYVCVLPLLCGCFMFSKQDIHQISLCLNFFLQVWFHVGKFLHLELLLSRLEMSYLPIPWDYFKEKLLIKRRVLFNLL